MTPDHPRADRRSWRDRLLLWLTGIVVFATLLWLAHLTGLAAYRVNVGRICLIVLVALVLFENWRQTKPLR